MEIERNDSIIVTGVDWLQVMIDGETEEIFRTDDLADSDVKLEIHDYGGEDDE